MSPSQTIGLSRCQRFDVEGYYQLVCILHFSANVVQRGSATIGLDSEGRGPTQRMLHQQKQSWEAHDPRDETGPRHPNVCYLMKYFPKIAFIYGEIAILYLVLLVLKPEGGCDPLRMSYISFLQKTQLHV